MAAIELLLPFTISRVSSRFVTLSSESLVTAFRLFLICLAIPLAAACANDKPAPASPLKTAFRRPAQAVLLDEGKLLAIANQRSGSVTLMETASGKVLSETQVGMKLTAITALPRLTADANQETRLALTDFTGHELIFALLTGHELKVTRRVSVARYPVGVAESPDGETAVVASRWSRRLTLVPADDETTKPRVLDLPFAPGSLAFGDAGSLIVSEAFGGRIGVLPHGKFRLQVHELPVHNVRDLAVRDGRLWFSHQLLRDTARTEEEHIHWGVLIENFVSSLPLESLIRANETEADALTLQPERVRIGDAGDGAGDPSGVAVMSDRLAVTIAGTAQLALIDRVGVREIRLPTGARPVQVLCDETRQRAFVVNSIGESVTIVDLKEPAVIRTIPLGKTPKRGRVERGEAAFFNARLSLENWMSCHSCHTDGHTSNRLADTLGDGGYGNAKRIPTLLGTKDTGPWAWTGSQKTLRGQLQKSFRSTMHSPSPTPEVVSDLTAYLMTLPPAPSLLEARRPSSSQAKPAFVLAGANVFQASGCVECHAGRQFTANSAFDVELEDQLGLRRFNPPSLKGVSQRDRLLHDGRARSLDEVLDVHPPRHSLSREERSQLIEFLSSL